MSEDYKNEIQAYRSAVEDYLSSRFQDETKPQKELFHAMGDGALTGGLAYEGLNNAGASREPMIVILNDNGMIDVTVTNGEQTLLRDTALNDAVVTKGAIARVIQISLFCDGSEAASFSGDGVIICTPTGSTAYSMLAGAEELLSAADAYKAGRC